MGRDNLDVDLINKSHPPEEGKSLKKKKKVQLRKKNSKYIGYDGKR
jgi:hypothetical protein